MLRQLAWISDVVFMIAYIKPRVGDPQTHGTTLDGRPVAPNKPVQLRDGARLAFGTSPAAVHVVRCESSGIAPALRCCLQASAHDRSGGAPLCRATVLLLAMHQQLELCMIGSGQARSGGAGRMTVGWRRSGSSAARCALPTCWSSTATRGGPRPGRRPTSPAHR